MAEVRVRKGGSVLCAFDIPREQISPYGVFDVTDTDDEDVKRVHGMVEKPKPEDAPSNLAVVGRYILTPAIFEMLDRTPLGTGGELQLTDGIRMLLEREKIYGYTFEGKRHDAGDKLGFLKATVEFALKRDELGPQFRAYLQSLDLKG